MEKSQCFHENFYRDEFRDTMGRKVIKIICGKCNKMIARPPYTTAHTQKLYYGEYRGHILADVWRIDSEHLLRGVRTGFYEGRIAELVRGLESGVELELDYIPTKQEFLWARENEERMKVPIGRKKELLEIIKEENNKSESFLKYCINLSYEEINNIEENKNKSVVKKTWLEETRELMESKRIPPVDNRYGNTPI